MHAQSYTGGRASKKKAGRGLYVGYLTTSKNLFAPRIETHTRPIFMPVYFSANSMMLID